MKRLFETTAATLAVAIALADRAPHVRTDNAADIVELTISSDTPAASVSAPPTVMLTLTNETGGPITIVTTSPYLDYQLSCTDESGSPVPLTKYGTRLSEGGPVYARSTRVLAPGQKDEAKIELGKIFKFPKPGQYSVYATRTFYRGDPGRGASLVSNTLTFSLSS